MHIDQRRRYEAITTIKRIYWWTWFEKRLVDYIMNRKTYWKYDLDVARTRQSIEWAVDSDRMHVTITGQLLILFLYIYWNEEKSNSKSIGVRWTWLHSPRERATESEHQRVTEYRKKSRTTQPVLGWKSTGRTIQAYWIVVYINYALFVSPTTLIPSPSFWILLFYNFIFLLCIFSLCLFTLIC